MNILYILGNGFDKAQGMKTSYPEFYQYLMENTDSGSPLLQQLKKDIKEETLLWSDMEEAFGQFTSRVKNPIDLENLYFELSDYLQEYLEAEENAFNPSEKQKNKFVEDFIRPARYMGEIDKIRYNDFIKRVGAGHDICVMTLNYTDTLERLLSLGSATDKRIDSNNYFRQVIHVHGRLNDSIIIGVDNEEQIANEQFRKNEDVTDFLIKIKSNVAMKYTRHRTCESLISNAHLIILYGVSLGKTDARWWKLIGEQFKKRNNLCVIQYLYKPNEILSTRKQLLGRLERKQQQCIMKAFGIKNEEWSEDAADRLFFITNSNVFKI